MAVSREKWVDQVAGKLSGAFREWCKQKISEQIGYRGHDWNQEVETLVHSIKPYLNGEKKTKSKFKILLAFSEVIEDVLGDNRPQRAKHLLEEHPLTKSQRMKLERLILNEQELLQQMLEKHLSVELKKIGYKF